jgi:hypothetical protein
MMANNNNNNNNNMSATGVVSKTMQKSPKRQTWKWHFQYLEGRTVPTVDFIFTIEKKGFILTGTISFWSVNKPRLSVS